MMTIWNIFMLFVYTGIVFYGGCMLGGDVVDMIKKIINKH